MYTNLTFLSSVFLSAHLYHNTKQRDLHYLFHPSGNRQPARWQASTNIPTSRSDTYRELIPISPHNLNPLSPCIHQPVVNQQIETLPFLQIVT